MADRTIVLATNGRHSVRGLTAVNGQEFKAYQETDDNLTYVVDMSSYLDGDLLLHPRGRKPAATLSGGHIQHRYSFTCTKSSGVSHRYSRHSRFLFGMK